MIGTIKAITNCNEQNQGHHCEAPKRSQDKPLTRDEEGRGNQPWSHKAALPTNATRAFWGRHEYHNDTHPATTIIVTGASITAMQVWWLPPWTRRPPKQETSGRLGKFMPLISRNKCGINNKTCKKELVSRTKNEAAVSCMPRITHTMLAGQAANWVTWQSYWQCPQWQQNKRKWRQQQKTIVVEIQK
jgi:hypothetical protein